jgi:hypothetical protein
MTLELGGFDPRATYSAAAEDYERASQRFWQLRARSGPLFENRASQRRIAG